MHVSSWQGLLVTSTLLRIGFFWAHNLEKVRDYSESPLASPAKKPEEAQLCGRSLPGEAGYGRSAGTTCSATRRT
jgi:hypothetical protein